MAKKLQEIKFKTLFVEFSNKLDTDCFTEEGTKVVALPVEIKLSLSIINLLNRCNEGDNSYVLNISQKTITLE